MESVTIEDSSGSDAKNGHGEGIILHARRRQPTTAQERARIYAFKQIPPLQARTTDSTAAVADVGAVCAGGDKGNQALRRNHGGFQSGDETRENVTVGTMGSWAENGDHGVYAPAFDGARGDCGHDRVVGMSTEQCTAYNDKLTYSVS